VTRLYRIIVHNWPLKLAAVGLATLLYGGLVLSQSTQTFTDVIQVDVRNQPPDTFIVETIDPVTEVRYFAPSGARPIASTFEAWVDLEDVPVGGGPVPVPIQVRAIDDRFTVISYVPDAATVQLDPLKTRVVPVDVQYPPPPEGLGVGTPVVEPAMVTVSGPASVVDTVVSARADVVIQASGISVDQEVQLVPVDALGNAVSPVNLLPPTALVTLPVFQDLRSKTLPVSPVITGNPAPGFEVAAVTVEPTVVTVEGDAEQLATLTRVDTEPVSTNGASADFEVDVELAVPAGIVPVDAETVHVTVELRPVTATRSFESGLRLVGTQPDLVYAPGVDRVFLTVGGSVADLDRLSGSTIVVDLDVSDLGVGTFDVPPSVDLPAGVTVVSIDPEVVPVTVSAPSPPSATATPAAGTSPTASPGG
jgi:YbbR domain-containing protein